jgi:hypothetical protein
MSAVPVLVGVVGLAGAAAVSVAVVSHAKTASDREDVAQTTAVAQRFALPDHAHRSHECHGDGVVACFTLPTSVTQSADAVASNLTIAALKHAGVQCTRVHHGAAAGLRSCVVAVRWDTHAVVAFVEPHVVRRAGHPAVAGTLVSLSAA